MSAAEIAALLAQENWHEERKALRNILRDEGLEEVVKWGKLCYMHAGSNVAIIFALKASCGISFFKGALLPDPDGLLERQTRNMQSVRILRFTSLDDIRAADATIRRAISDAKAVEERGESVTFDAKHNLTLPGELTEAMAQDAELRAAFEALTPGRKRGYVLHIEGAKQASTRAARIARHRDRIIAGKGINER